ncbi:MAG: NADAR family protein [Cyanobacteria bacterium SZAS LIN-5]|jgi:N-glycosidase YbiA|nr:NADAR family protein [Cyanobacteria bacterium SZAS LIN-5]
MERMMTTIDSEQVIRFYRVSEDYGCFSNFYASPLSIDERVWPTVEHYFQAQKFLDLEIQERIRETKSPMVAARMGRDRKKPLRADWESVKIDLMVEAVRAKFTQHEGLRKILLSTGTATLVEHTKGDKFWGDGGDGTGKNMLGVILMRIRDEFIESL